MSVLDVLLVNSTACGLHPAGSSTWKVDVGNGLMVITKSVLELHGASGEVYVIVYSPGVEFAKSIVPVFISNSIPVKLAVKLPPLSPLTTGVGLASSGQNCVSL